MFAEDEYKKYIPLKEVELYRFSRQLSDVAWQIFSEFYMSTKKTIGSQFISAVDSVLVNIIEAHKRFHDIDKLKYMYMSHASLCEACSHWAELLHERKRITEEQLYVLKDLQEEISAQLCECMNETAGTEAQTDAVFTFEQVL